MGIKESGLEENTQVGIVIGMGLNGEAMDGELKISMGQTEGKRGIVANWEELVEFVGECVEERGVGSSGNRAVDKIRKTQPLSLVKTLKLTERRELASLRMEVAVMAL